MQIELLPAGTVIRVSCGWYDHVGMLADYWWRNERAVISFSPKARGILEERLSDFARGREIHVDGYLGNLSPFEVMRRARFKRGQPYSWTTFNCEHFIRCAHGVEIESPQLQRFAFLGFCGFATLAVARAQ